MRLRGLLTAALSLVLIRAGPAIAQHGPLHPLARDDVERFADSAFAGYLAESAAPSLAVVVVHGDSVLLAKGYGRADDSLPVSVDGTAYHIASLSKLFVVTAVMQQVERGRIALDAPVARFLPELGIPANVTVRHLLTHTSGLDSPFLADVVNDASELQSLADYFAAHPPVFGRSPGNEIRYSNHGMALAALIVETVSGEPFDAYVERHIFRPLGMLGSTIRQPPPPEIHARIATAGAGRVPDYLQVYPAGAIVSTPADMGKFMGMLLGGAGETAVLSAQSLAVMQQRQWTAHRAIPGVALGFFESDMGGVRALFHTGARTHFSLIYLLPEQRVGVFIVHSMRQGGPFQSLRTDIARAFVDRYIARGPQAQEPGASVPAVRAVAGTYRPILFSGTTLERAAWLLADTRVRAHDDGSLEVRLPASRPLRLVPHGAVFRVVDGEHAGLAAAFDDAGARGRMFLAGATYDPMSFVRLSWYERGLFHFALLVVTAIVMISYAPGAAVAGTWRVVRKTERPAVGAAERRAHWPVLGSSVLLAAAPAVALATLALSANASGPRPAISVFGTLFYAGSVLGLAGALTTVAVWRRAHWSRGRRAYLAAFVMCAPVLFALATYYHLGPFWL